MEQIGIARSWEAIAQADLVLHLVDATQAQQPELLTEIRSKLKAAVPVITVYNKLDLLGPESVLAHEAQAESVWISARTGEGLDSLRGRILQIAGWDSSRTETPYLARERHLQALHQTDQHLQAAAEHAAQSDRVLDLFAEELRLAHDALGEITGRVGSDDLLGVIFGRFCIGK